MKKIQLLIGMTIFSLPIYAQTGIEKIADAMCTKITSMTPEELKGDSMESYMLEQLILNKEQIEKEENIIIDLNDDTVLDKVFESLPEKLVERCPEGMLKLGSLYEDFEGKIINVQKGDFYTITLEGEAKTTMQFIILADFEGSEIFTNGTWKNKLITVEYKEEEFLNAKTNQVEIYNVISSIEGN